MRRLWSIAPLLFLLQLPVVIGDCNNKMDADREQSGFADGAYVGHTVRLETSCFSDGDCFACSANDNVQLNRANGEITIIVEGPSLTFTPCVQDPATEQYTLKGNSESVVDGDFHKFTITDCNHGAFPGAGAGVLEGNKITVSFSCEFDDDGSRAQWNDVVLTKQ